MRAGIDNNPALQNLQRLILGLTDLTFLTFLDKILAVFKIAYNKLFKKRHLISAVRTLNNVSKHTGILGQL